MHRNESLCVSDPTTSGRVKQVFPKPRLKEEVASIGFFFLLLFFSRDKKESEQEGKTQKHRESLSSEPHETFIRTHFRHFNLNTTHHICCCFFLQFQLFQRLFYINVLTSAIKHPKHQVSISLM